MKHGPHRIGEYEFDCPDFEFLASLASEAGRSIENLVEKLSAPASFSERVECYGKLSRKEWKTPMSVCEGKLRRLFLDTDELGIARLPSPEGVEIESVWLVGERPLENLGALQSLRRLFVPGNDLSDLDLSRLPHLHFLDCRNNRLETLELSANPDIRTMVCSDNRLRRLHLEFASELRFLDCSKNQIEILGLDRHDHLEFVFCNSNKVRDFSLEYGRRLQWLNCRDNDLQALRLEGFESLSRLDCSSNPIESLDCRFNPFLEILACGENPHNQEPALTKLDLSESRNLKELKCSFCEISQLDLSRCTELERLFCKGTKIEELDLSKNRKIKSISCGGGVDDSRIVRNFVSPLKILEISRCQELTSLHCEHVRDLDLDVSKNRTLEILECDVLRHGLPPLPSLKRLRYESDLDLSKVPNLEELVCYGAEEEELDFLATPKLKSLHLVEYNGERLDLSKAPNLEDLYCVEAGLERLDLFHNPKLTCIRCGTNRLRSLDLSRLPELRSLNCGENEIEVLDFSRNPKLVFLYCSNNRLKRLDLSVLTSDEITLNCDGDVEIVSRASQIIKRDEF